MNIYSAALNRLILKLRKKTSLENLKIKNTVWRRGFRCISLIDEDWSKFEVSAEKRHVFNFIVEIWHLKTDLLIADMAEKLAEFLTDSWDIAENVRDKCHSCMPCKPAEKNVIFSDNVKRNSQKYLLTPQPNKLSIRALFYLRVLH